MSCKTCHRALAPEGHDADGNCPDCAVPKKVKAKAKKKAEEETEDE